MQKGDFVYRLERENQNGKHLYICIFNCGSRTITLKDNVIIKINGKNHNHDAKLSNCTYNRVLSDIEKSIPDHLMMRKSKNL